MFILCLFIQTKTFFTPNQCEKCPSNIPRRDSSSRPLEYELSPMTTAPARDFLIFPTHIVHTTLTVDGAEIIQG